MHLEAFTLQSPRPMGVCYNYMGRALFGVSFLMLITADRPGAGGVAADSADAAGLDQPSQRHDVFADLDGEPSPGPCTPRSTHARALPPGKF